MKFDLRNLVIAVMSVLITFLALRSCKHEAGPEVKILQDYKTKDSIYRSIFLQDSETIKNLQEKSDSLAKAVADKDTIIKQIPVKYETVRNNIRSLNADQQIRLLSDWLSEISSN